MRAVSIYSTHFAESSISAGVTNPMRTTNSLLDFAGLKAVSVHTVVQPVRRRRERDALAAHRQREDLAGQDPADRPVGHAVRGRVDIHTTVSANVSRKEVGDGARCYAPDGEPSGANVDGPIVSVGTDLRDSQRVLVPQVVVTEWACTRRAIMRCDKAIIMLPPKAMSAVAPKEVEADTCIAEAAFGLRRRQELV